MGINKIKCIIALSILSLTSFEKTRNTDAAFYPDQTVQSKKVKKAQSKTFKAKVIRIIDGDTLEVLYGQLPVKIRLSHIDCPEKRGKQPFGNAAKEALSDLCFGQTVKVDWTSKDRNGRFLAVIYNKNGLNVNKEMVKKGMAWHYKKFSTDTSYTELENKARKQKIGLWKDPRPVAPWDWRSK